MNKRSWRGVLLLAAALIVLPADAVVQEREKVGGFNLSVQAWTFNQFTAFEAIEKTSQSGAKLIELFPGQKMKADSDIQIGPGMDDAATNELIDHLKKNNVRAIAFGVTGISRDEAEARKLFAWAKKVGIEIINTESTDALDTMEKMVKEFDMKVGFHNHPKRDNDANYKVWDPNYVLSIVKDRDQRIGACADTGHWVRSGIKPIDAIKILKGRVVSSHLKDLHEFAPSGHDVPYGTGVSDIAAILTELKAQGFTGSLSIEYEHNWDKSLPEVAQCVGYVRGRG